MMKQIRKLKEIFHMISETTKLECAIETVLKTYTASANAAQSLKV
jgi:hypothetical protein